MVWKSVALAALVVSSQPARAFEALHVCHFRAGQIVIDARSSGQQISVEVEGRARPYRKAAAAVLPLSAGLPSFVYQHPSQWQWRDETGTPVETVTCGLMS